MLQTHSPAEAPAAYRFEDVDPSGRELRAGRPFFPGLVASLDAELRGLCPDHAAGLTEGELRAVERARNVFRTRRRIRERRARAAAGLPADLPEPEADAELEREPIRELRLGKSRYAAYRSTLLKVCPWCSYCGRKLDAETATLDHVLPKARGGENIPANLVLACEGCNQSKGSDTPAGWAFRVVRAVNDPREFDRLREMLDCFENSPDDGEPVLLAFRG